jgi:hypothetical protein
VAGNVVQLVPFQDSVAALSPGSCPPNAKAAVCIPAPPNSSLAVFKELTVVQLVPFQDSVAAVTAVTVVPPKNKPAV